jgi:acetone carboxylase gamma subunit
MQRLDPAVVEQLLDGRLPWSRVHAIMSSHKDRERFATVIEIHQRRLGWEDRILLPYGDNLFIVERSTGERVVRCTCGHEFGDYKVNWKLSALIFVRNTPELIGEIYPELMGSDPSWMELREYYCPGCQRQLEVEAVPPGYPVIFDFEPDLEALYEDWLTTEQVSGGEPAR